MGYVVKIDNGRAVIYTTEGSSRCTLCSDAVQGYVQGDEAIITLRSGKVAVYSLQGSLKRTI